MSATAVPDAPGGVERRKRERTRWNRLWITEDGYLRLHLVAGFALALIASIAFAAIAEEVFETTDIIRVDAAAQAFARSLVSPRHTIAIQVITAFGSPRALVPFALVVCGWLLWKRSHRRLYGFVAANLGGAILDQLLKLWFHRARPENPLAVAHGYSFPSGHSMGSFIFFASLAYVYCFSLDRHPVTRVLAMVACILAPIVIGASRIYLGVHYFTDVVGGYVAGLAWLGICLASVEAWVHFRDRRLRRMAG